MSTVPCVKCGNWFYREKYSWKVCRECLATYQREYMREYRAARPGFENERYKRRVAEDPTLLEKKRIAGVTRWRELRRAAYKAYGGAKCACCGEAEPKFLSLDHINNDGGEHRRAMNGQRGSQVFQWLKTHNYPPGFQVLCMNCNHGKALNGGVCPHKSPDD